MENHKQLDPRGIGRGYRLSKDNAREMEVAEKGKKAKLLNSVVLEALLQCNFWKLFRSINFGSSLTVLTQEAL